jgi:hypothetical protein
MTKETITSMTTTTTDLARPRVRPLAASLAAPCLAALLALAAATPARADLGFEPGSVQLTTSTTQAGGHPDVTTAFSFKTFVDAQNHTVTDGNVKDIQVRLPAGLIGDATAMGRCHRDQLLDGRCPIDSQVGISTITLDAGQGVVDAHDIPVYNMDPSPGEPATLAQPIQEKILVPWIEIHVRTGDDYGVTAELRNLTTSGKTLRAATLTLWGVPADPSHDGWRAFVPFAAGTGATSEGVFGASSSADRRPFMINPTACGASLATTMRASSWQHPGVFDTATVTSPAMTRCDRLRFDPSLSVQPQSTQADSPSGYTVDLKVPQNDNPDGLATATLRKATVALPAGVSVDPSSADGLAACTPTQIGWLGDSPTHFNADEPRCPDASKIGTVEIATPLLPDHLTGSIYLAKQNDNPFGSLFAIYLVAEADGVLVKLPGKVEPDAVTGQLKTTFDDNPQLPFSELTLRFKGGPRAALANPPSCGTFTTTSELTPWSAPDSGPAATPSDSFDITTGCSNLFAPRLSAGVLDPTAGASSPFVFRLTRDDGNQTLSQIRDVRLPAGLLASIKGVPLCGDADAAAGTCDAGSQIGEVTTGAGPGSQPFYLPGKVFLTTGYKGAPYGLSILVPAIAGPFDLGNVVVRAAVNVDPTTAALSVDADPLPTIIDGIPLRLRDIALNINRPGFMRNPTNCEPAQISANAMSTAGTLAAVSNRFRVGHCAALGFSPRLRMKLTGRGQTTDGRHPALSATVTQPDGQANLQYVRVKLPLSLALDPNNSQHVCGYQAGLQDQCPADTIVGHATAVSPLLNRPLTGPVYLVQGIRFDASGQQRRTLPTLLVPLRGELAIDLRAQSSVAHGKLVTTFGSIPDAQISSFNLTINGGRKGILVVTHNQNLCAKKQVSRIAERGQNGKVRHLDARMQTPCPSKHKSTKKT